MSTTRTAFLHPVINPTLPDPAEFLDELRAIFASGQVTLGKHVAALEADVCSRTGVANTVAMSSGTSGLMLLLRALRLPEGSEVITPSFTFAATSHALLWNNLVPVFCDSEPESFTMDAEKAESLVTERTSAIYPVCIFGVPGDIDAYQSIADRHGLHLLFDSAQGLGAGYKGRAVGNFGNGEVFSLSPTKVVTSLEGGLVTTNNDGLAEQLRSMRDYGKAPGGEDMVYRGLSARMTEINALVARWSLARAGTWIANRAAVMERYEERLSMIPGIMFQRIPTHCTSSRNYVVITLDPQVSRVSRDELYMWLKSQGIQTKRYFFPALHNQTLYRHIDPGCARRLPVAEYIAANAIALPMYSHMNLETVDEISDRIIECFERAGVYTE